MLEQGATASSSKKRKSRMLMYAVCRRMQAQEAPASSSKKRKSRLLTYAVC
jgi:hypothetical protein